MKNLIKNQKRLIKISKKLTDRLYKAMDTKNVSEFYLNNIRRPKYTYTLFHSKFSILYYKRLVNNYVNKLNNFSKVPLEKNSNFYCDTQQLYVMQNEYGLFKIGISKDPERRRRQLKNAGGVNIDLLLALWVGNAKEQEKMLHQIFNTSRKKGEFFKFEGSVSEVLEVILSKLKRYKAGIVNIDKI